MHHNILREKQSSSTKIQPSNTFCDIRLQPRDVDNYASTSTCYDCNVVTFKNQKKVLCTPCCHGWPRASRGRLSRFPQIIVGSSLSSADPHWPDFLPFPAVTLLWRLLQSRLQKTDGDEEIIICRNADGKVQLFLLDQSDIFEQSLKSKILAEGHLSAAPIIWFLGCLRVSLKSGPDDNTCF